VRGSGVLCPLSSTRGRRGSLPPQLHVQPVCLSLFDNLDDVVDVTSATIDTNVEAGSSVVTRRAPSSLFEHDSARGRVDQRTSTFRFTCNITLTFLACGRVIRPVGEESEHAARPQPSGVRHREAWDCRVHSGSGLTCPTPEATCAVVVTRFSGDGDGRTRACGREKASVAGCDLTSVRVLGFRPGDGRRGLWQRSY